MADSELPSPELLRKLLRYDSETGHLYWRERTPDLFKNSDRQKQWNAQYAGKRALAHTTDQGYQTGTILHRRILAHRAAWAVHYGSWPSGSLDHLNHNRSDNRIRNLRIATHKENCKNRGRHACNKTGVTGVSWRRKNSKWVAQISGNGKKISLGHFENFDDAVAARRAAERKYGYHENHGADHG